MIGLLLVMVSSICFAVVPNAGKVALDDGVSLFVLIVTRYAIGAAILAPIIALTKTSIRVPRRLIPKLLFVSMMALLLLMATYHAVDHLDIGLVLLILFSFPIGVALCAARRWFCMGMVMAGLAIMIIDGIDGINLYGLFISAMGLVFFVLFIDSSSELAVELGSSTLNLYISLTGLMALLLAYGVAMIVGGLAVEGLPVEGLPVGISIAMPESTRGLTAIWANGVFYIVSWVLFFEGARIVGATRAALMACVEPLFAALLALMVLGQRLSAVEWGGFFIVLGAIYAFERLGQKTSDQSQT
ncbi:MAG: DMT family transporter [Alphaproteobacteria bacterium]|nr:DMT family transporter [Alphaproteobacteria bacterium]